MNKFSFVFDMDGVIVDTNPYHQITLRQFAERHGYKLSEEELIKNVYGRTNKEWIPNLFGRSMSSQELEQYGEEKESLFRELYKQYIKPLDGLVEFLSRCQKNNIPLAVGTSAPVANLNFVMEHIPIRLYFSVLLDESHVRVGKPNPEIYQKCADKLNLPPEQCIVFEDSLSGVAAAHAAGCPCVGVSTTHTAAELGTAVTINNFVDVDPISLASKLIH